MNYLRSFLLTAIMLTSACSKEPSTPAPEVFGPMPSFHFTDSLGQGFSEKNLQGKFGVMNFFFSSCQGICPTINGYMRSVVNDFKNVEGFTAVSLSVDPERDTPSTLLNYSKKYIPTGFPHWYFLTQADVSQSSPKTLIAEGFRLAQGEAMDMHSTRIVFFDRNFQVRGYYKGLEAGEILRLKQDIKSFLQAEDE